MTPRPIGWRVIEVIDMAGAVVVAILYGAMTEFPSGYADVMLRQYTGKLVIVEEYKFRRSILTSNPRLAEELHGRRERHVLSTNYNHGLVSMFYLKGPAVQSTMEANG